MLNQFWNKQKILIGFSGFVAALGALFLNIAPPTNNNAKLALANIQVFWLIILIINLTILFYRFIKLIFHTEKEFERKHDIAARGIYSSTALLLFLWVILNFLSYILSSYPGPFTILIFMLSGAIIIGLFSWGEYLIHSHLEKFSIFSELFAESFGVAVILTFGIILTDGFFFQSKYLHWAGLVGIGIFAAIFIANISISKNRGRKIFISRVLQDMTIPHES